jgi:hypothetical protein
MNAKFTLLLESKKKIRFLEIHETLKIYLELMKKLLGNNLYSRFLTSLNSYNLI